MNFSKYLIKILSICKITILKLLQILRLDILYKKFRSLRPKYQAGILGFLLILLIAYKLFMHPAWPEDIKIVEIYKAEKSDLLVTTKLLGSIEAKRFFTIEALSPGIISFIAEAGSKLSKGERIASIDAPEIEDAYESALKAAKIAKNQYEREKKLLKAGASSQNKLEQKYMELAGANNTLANAKINLDKILFTAPFSGIVGSPLLYEGSKANPGDKIVTFYDDTDLVVKFDIPSEIASKISPKTIATIDDNEYSIFVQQALSKNSYSVPAYTNYLCDKCIIGEITDVNLHITHKKDILAIPTSCVFIKNGKKSIYKIEDDKAMLHVVKTGLKHEDKVEILEGIEVGDIIISEGQARLYPTVKVKIYNGQ